MYNEGLASFDRLSQTNAGCPYSRAASSPQRKLLNERGISMVWQRVYIETRLRVPTDTLALIDQTVAKAREEFDDTEVDRQRVLELLIEQRLEP